MKRTVEQLEHTEEFKRAVETCKSQRKSAGKNPENCFAIITDQFKKSGKPIFVKDRKSKHSEYVEQGLQELDVTIYSEFGGS
jgi:hypothetical protein